MNKELLKKISSNKILHYIFSRYFTYLIQFVNSILIAIYLGPFFLGVWGFINLVTQYFTQMDLGITVSFNVLGSIHKSDKKFVSDIFNTTFFMFAVLSAVAIVPFIFNQVFSLNIGAKYNFSTYAMAACAIIVMSNFNALFATLFRINGYITEIAISQSCLPVIMFLTVIIFRHNHLIWALIIANLFSLLVSLSIFIFRSPIKIKPIVKLDLIKIVQKKAIFLFIYNTAFDFIIISVRSFISGYYAVNEFGYFTFAFLMANAIMMLLDSLSFVILPKFINKLAHTINTEAQTLIERLRSDYIVASYSLVYLAVFLIPVFFHFFPKYEPSLKVFRISVLAIVLNTNCFGYQALLFSKNKERLLSLIAVGVLVFNIITCLIIAKVFQLPFYFIVIAIAFSYCIFSIIIIYYGRKLLEMDSSIRTILKTSFPFRLLLPYIVCLFIVLSNLNWIFYTIPLLLFVAFNFKSILKLKSAFISIVNSPDIIKI